MIEFEHVTKSFPAFEVFNNLDFKLPAGKRLCLTGHSGSGKTTLLRLIAGFDSPDDGCIALGGKVVSNPHIIVPSQHRHVAMVFQSFALWPHMTARSHIEYVLPHTNSRNRKKQAEELLDEVQLTGRGSSYPCQLSGGQQQRLTIARALAPKPKILLLDEPFASLDADLKTHMAELLLAYITRNNMAVVCSTQQPDSVAAFTDCHAAVENKTIQWQ